MWVALHQRQVDLHLKLDLTPNPRLTFSFGGELAPVSKDWKIDHSILSVLSTEETAETVLDISVNQLMEDNLKLIQNAGLMALALFLPLEPFLKVNVGENKHLSLIAEAGAQLLNQD